MDNVASPDAGNAFAFHAWAFNVHLECSGHDENLGPLSCAIGGAALNLHDLDRLLTRAACGEFVRKADQLLHLVGARQQAMRMPNPSGNEIMAMARRRDEVNREIGDFVGANWPFIVAAMQAQAVAASDAPEHHQETPND